ncbi:MAG: tetratricopeptide repeat protein [Spirochaetes bacterium]|nr:tetratricopeptide repeat protein [Spirochaetota bacterium]
MKQITIAVALLFIMVINADSAVISGDKGSRIKVFYTMNDRTGQDAIQKGKIISYSSKDEYNAADLFGQAQDKSKATVRLHDAEGISEGDILYVINDKNLIIAKMAVRTIFKSASFGPMLVGYGNFRLSSVGDRVIVTAGSEESKYSYIYKARGDYYHVTGEDGEAINEYKNALKVDANNPNAHLALGLVYLNQGLDQFALREFNQAKNNISRLYDNEDKFILLRSIAEISYRNVYETFMPRKLKEKYRDEGMKACKDALRIYPKSERMYYYLGVFSFRTSDPDDRAAKDYLLKVIELNPSHANAYVALSELYYRHDNMIKARMFAEKAIEADNGNIRAQKMLKYIESKEQIKQ